MATSRNFVAIPTARGCRDAATCVSVSGAVYRRSAREADRRALAWVVDNAAATSLVAELCRASPDFARLWQDNDVAAHGEGVKRIHHPDAGLLELEFSSFAVEGRPELGMIIYNPASPQDAERLRALIESKAAGAI